MTLRKLSFPLLIVAAAAAVTACDTLPVAAPQPATIPEAAQGRWGLTAADCTSTPGDAKGLMTVGATRLTFYESRGTLTAVAERAPDRIDASFDFTGEGMSWTRREILEVQDNGMTLVRREFGEDALPGPFTYTKCG